MSTVLNSPRKTGRATATAMACLLGLFALAAFGCSDHGPGNLVSEELFNKKINGPALEYYSANQISFTVQTDSGCDNCSSLYTYTVTYNGNSIVAPNMSVVVANDGGSGTSGPGQCYFAVQTDQQTGVGLGFADPTTDPIVVNMEGNTKGGNGWYTPQDGNDPSNCDCGTAVSNLGSGSEIGAFAQTQVTLYQGYFNGNNENSGYVDDTQYFSLAFTVSPGTLGTASW